MNDRCSCKDCNEKATHILKVFGAGYCDSHWREIAGNLRHLPVLRIYPCPDCKWTFSNDTALKRHQLSHEASL